MPVTLNTSLTDVPRVQPQRKLWTREECAALESAGVVDLERYELIAGELIQKVSKTHPHTRSLMLLAEWLIGVFGVQFVAPEAVIGVSLKDNPRSEPEP